MIGRPSTLEWQQLALSPAAIRRSGPKEEKDRLPEQYNHSTDWTNT